MCVCVYMCTVYVLSSSGKQEFLGAGDILSTPGKTSPMHINIGCASFSSISHTYEELLLIGVNRDHCIQKCSCWYRWYAIMQQNWYLMEWSRDEY